jgi:hypothetical protein
VHPRVYQTILVVSVRDEQDAIVMWATVATAVKAIIGLVRGLSAGVKILSPWYGPVTI